MDLGNARPLRLMGNAPLVAMLILGAWLEPRKFLGSRVYLYGRRIHREI